MSFVLIVAVLFILALVDANAILTGRRACSRSQTVAFVAGLVGWMTLLLLLLGAAGLLLALLVVELGTPSSALLQFSGYLFVASSLVAGIATLVARRTPGCASVSGPV